MDVEGDREQLRHDAVVCNQASQAGMDLHETLKPKDNLRETFLTTKFYFYLIAILQLKNDVVSDSKWMERVGHAD